MLTCKMYAYNIYLISVYFIEVHFTGIRLTGVRLIGIYLNRRESQQARTLYACVLSTGVRLSTEVATNVGHQFAGHPTLPATYLV